MSANELFKGKVKDTLYPPRTPLKYIYIIDGLGWRRRCKTLYGCRGRRWLATTL